MATSKRVANRQHRWLSSVEITGVVLSEPVLADAGNFRSLDKAEIAAFRKQREIWNLPKGMVEGNGQPAWINFILEDFLGLKDRDYWQVGAAIPADKVVNLHEQQELLRPSRVLLDEGNAIMLVLEVPREQSLDKPWLQDRGRWKASPTTKFERLLRETGVELGLLTNGEAWRLVVASPSETTSWMTWTAQTWNDDPLTLAAFKDLLGESRFFAGPRDQVILELIKQSRQRQLDVADQLGNQVREALQSLVHELDRVDAELGGEYLRGYSEAEIFESSVAFIMRLLFTLYAEENGLLPHGNVTYDRAYGVLHLLTELEETRRLAPEKLKHSYAAYARLLASSRLLHDGSVDADIRIAAHGGQLFDPNRYPLLEGRAKNGNWPTEVPEPPKVRDAVIRDILRSLKYAKADGVRQLVSYRTLAVEQIGHMYEGLLDRRVARAPANQTLLLLQGGSKIAEPEPVNANEFAGLEQAALIKAIAQHTSKTAGTIKKVLERNEDRHTQANLGTDDAELLAQAKPVERFLQPLGIVRPGGLYVTHGQDRRSSGAHYTPPTLTEPVVRRTLEHQVYVNVEGKPGLLVEPRLIKTPQEILSLKVCDPAMGSGAFLVQATRYLAERLVDAWERMASEQPDTILTMPFGSPSQGEASENLMPESREERIVFARRYVAERCIYGVDMNRLAVEMAKLSLWLATLSTDRPFTFVDHALKHGNSLIGLSAEQIRNFTWKPVSNDFGPLFANQPDQEVEEAEQHREAIHAIPDHDFTAKEKENRIAEEVLSSIRLRANLALAAFFNGANTKQRENNLISYRYWLERLNQDEKAFTQIDNIVKGLTTGEKPIIPFCWEAEFPEVFYRKNCGFDVVVGNPPFLGGRRISMRLGSEILDYLKLNHPNNSGSADLCAYFIRQSMKLTNNKGAFGFILSDVVSQGDTREVGFGYAINKGADIFYAIKSMDWPGSDAGIKIAIVCSSKSNFNGDKTLNETKCTRINSSLSIGSDIDIKPLNENKGICYSGHYLGSRGFVIDDELASQLKKSSSGCIFPYYKGEDINSNPKIWAGEYAIYFNQMSLREVKDKYPEALSFVEKYAKPDKDKAKRDRVRELWWQYNETRPGLMAAIEGLDHVIVQPFTFKYLCPTLVPSGCIYAHPMAVFARNDIGFLGILWSSIHWLWTNINCSTSLNLYRYTASSIVDTFPIFDCATNPEVVAASKAFIQKMMDLRVNNNLSQLDLLNRFNDPKSSEDDIKALRALRNNLDRSILNLYMKDTSGISYEFYTDKDRGISHYTFDEPSRTIVFELLKLENGERQSPT
jgi:hypothetical protein